MPNHNRLPPAKWLHVSWGSFHAANRTFRTMVATRRVRAGVSRLLRLLACIGVVVTCAYGDSAERTFGQMPGLPPAERQTGDKSDGNAREATSDRPLPDARHNVAGQLDPAGKRHIPIGVPNSLDSLKTFVEAEGCFSPGIGSYGIYSWV
jgi:hypothetical protein